MLSALVVALLLGHTNADTVDDQWVAMPDGRLHHRSCVHLHESEVHVPSDEPPCPHKPRPMVTAATAAALAGGGASSSYYSDWVVYAQYTASNGVQSLSSTWQVPPAPTSHGPAGLSSVYLFNGLEDSGGQRGTASMILQPVLQYGKSGCILDPLQWHEWHFLSYLVASSGRAHCGPRMRVREGEELVGNMTRLDAGAADADAQRWLVTATRTATGDVSSLTTDLTLPAGARVDTSYLTLEGMVVYSCDAYPSTAATAFYDNRLRDGDGQQIAIGDGRHAWLPKARHTECGQQALPAGNSVSLRYRNTTAARPPTPQ